VIAEGEVVVSCETKNPDKNPGGGFSKPKKGKSKARGKEFKAI
jgi:hypothetical protein